MSVKRALDNRIAGPLLAAVMRTMGHRDVRTVVHYQHPELEIVRAALDALSRYESERFLYRPSEFPSSFVLKGALRLQVWTAETYPPTQDVPARTRTIQRELEIFSKVCSQKVEDDGLSFVSDTIRIERIRDDEAA